jgi:hypothetical protein
MNDIGSTPRSESPPHAASENSNAHSTERLIDFIQTSFLDQR